MTIQKPYLLFIGDAKDTLSIKLAKGVADWRPEMAIGELALEGCKVSTGLPQLSLQAAYHAGAKTLVLGFTNSGGVIDDGWIPTIIEAIQLGMDVASGLHQKLDSKPEILQAAKKSGVKLIDVRHPNQSFDTGKGVARSGQRILTVGSDCSVGKMYTALALEKAMKTQGFNVEFKATGQCGIFIAGDGVAIDCVVSDFISGAVESISPATTASNWHIIEGQGSLFHPSFAGVSLGLLHGAQADALVLCHSEKRDHMRGVPEFKLPDLADVMALNLQHAKLTNPNAKFIGISINTSMLTEVEANHVCSDYEQKLGLPCVDPLRHGVDSIINRLA